MCSSLRETHRRATERLNVRSPLTFTLKFTMLCILFRCTVPEMWAACLKDHLHSSRAERDKTRRMCARIKEMLRETSNELWQHANISTNAITANIDRIRRDRVGHVDSLALVRIISQHTTSSALLTRAQVAPAALGVHGAKLGNSAYPYSQKIVVFKF